MADLPESPDWTPGVYQLETSDPVLGGPEGVSNQQAKQLANRTSWLKKKIDALLDGSGIPFASQHEAEKGADTSKPMSALRVFQAIGAKVVQATASAPGIARIATQIMVRAGTDNSTIVTPQTLAAMFPFRGRIIYEKPGEYTWDVPSGATRVWVVVIGAGGGGARSASAPGPTGGASGGIAKKLIDLTGITSVKVTVGEGGKGASVNEMRGTDGGTSSFGVYMSAIGGWGGSVNDRVPYPGGSYGGDENHSIEQVGDVIDFGVLAGKTSLDKGQGGLSMDHRPPRKPGFGGDGWRGAVDPHDGAAPGGAHGQVTIQW
jgi:hypothetical protein